MPAAHSEAITQDSLITVIGRGHSGTRAMSHTLTASGVFMGEPLNGSGDLLPPEDMYEACRVFARYVTHKGGLSWDFSRVLDPNQPIDPAFRRLIESYLTSVLNSDASERGWKIPETTLCYPWIQRLFPEARYIYWIRNPRDCILGGHVTDDLNDFDIEYPKVSDDRLRRAISWKYQYELVHATPAPSRWTSVRFEDFVLDQQATLDRLQRDLGFDQALTAIEVRPDATRRHVTDEGVNYFSFFEPEMKQYGYPIPSRDDPAFAHPAW